MNHGTAATGTHTAERESHGVWSGRLEAIDGFLSLFAKAVRQIHAYPVTSQVCVDAVNACRAHLSSIDGGDEIQLTVTPDQLLVHEQPVGDNQFVRHELVRRLRRARVAVLTIQRDCTPRDLTRGCVSILRCSESADRTLSVADMLAEDGVVAVSVEVTSRREVLPVAPSAPAQRDLVAHERRRRNDGQQPDTRTVNLFPPHRGWIRLDPAESYDAVSLADLAILVDDPNELAAMLDRLVDESPERAGDPRALERRFSNVAALFAGLEPRLSRMMFAKLGRVLMTMDADRRHALIKRAVLPAVFDGRPELNVLHTLSDNELAEALCLLFDPEHGGSALPLSALDQLDLSPERRAALLPLMEQLMRARIDPALGLDAATAIALDQKARSLTSIAATERRSFVELAGFDLRVDDQAQATIDAVCNGIRDTDGLMVEFLCLVNLVALQPNPEVAASFVQGVIERSNHLVAASRWNDLGTGLQRLAQRIAPLRERRPDIAALVDAELLVFATPELATALLEQHSQGEASQATALQLLDALGAAIAPSLLSLLESNARAASVAVGLMCERASLFAQALADGIPGYDTMTRTHVARILGHAGPGFEDALASLCNARDEKTTREALRALSRIGTARSAELVGVIARDARGWMATATIETLLRFPADIGAPAIRDLLAGKAFVLAHPAEASRLIGRLTQVKGLDLEPVLREIWSLRYRFWNRALVRAAHDAGALLKR